MIRRLDRLLFALFASWALMVPAAPLLAQEDLAAEQEKAMKAAMSAVAPSVVQIETRGGNDIISTGPMGGAIRKGVGPTTGLVVASDGFIISSAFNFANKPTEIFVSIPGSKDRFVAKVIATDHTRMLTLLKIEATKLPVPAATPRKDIKVGQWSMALGRTLANPDSQPSMSVGIISALDRIWGKAIQTDAKVSPVNYGGPLVDIQGRVQGVLVPASPRAQDETAGLEWYDSGIGFAIPLEDIFAVLPRLKAGQDLNRGYLGVTPQGADIYSTSPIIGSVSPESAAAKAGIKAGDVIVEIDGVKVVRQAQVMHLLGRKYEGDVASVKVKRGDKELSFADLKLAGISSSYARSFLGILPMRDDPELGVEVRYVYPKSPAEAAGLKPGDRILSLTQGTDAAKPFVGGDGLMALLDNVPAGAEVKLDVRRKGAKNNETLTTKLVVMPDSVPDALPEPASLKKALEPRKTIGPAPKPDPNAKKPEKKDPKKVETGMIKRSNAARDHEYWIYVPENYDPNISHALLVWLHPIGKGKEKDAKAMRNTWEDYCADNHIILVGPRAVNETGWLVSESDFIREAARDVMNQYTIDRQRVVIHGMGVGGQLAYYLGFNARDLFRGVVATGAALVNKPKPGVPNQRLSFFVVAGGKDPRVKSIQESKDKLLEGKFPVIYREIVDMGHEYLDAPTLKELVRWLDSLDRI